MTWTAPARNLDNVQHVSIRSKLDAKFNDVHDELSDCYYNKKPFRTFGILTREMFDKLHGLLYHIYLTKFHEANLALPANNRIPRDEYNEVRDATGTLIETKTETAASYISARNAEGITLVVE